MLIFLQTAVFATAACLWGQEPTNMAGQTNTAQSGSKGLSNSAALAGSKQDPAAVERGGKVFAANCAGCHGPAAKGGPGAPDLVRSILVLDDEKGLLIAPVVREGRPDKGMPKLGLSEAQISDVVAWLHLQTYAAGHRGTYTFQNIVTGDAQKGKTYFDGAGKCSSCHSVTGDLAGIGRKYDPLSLQSRWLQPRESRGRRARSSASKNSGGTMPTVTVTLASGQSFSGKLDQIDDFTVSLRDSGGDFRSFARDTANPPRVEIQDPLKAHTEMLRKYTDADIHNVTAYLVTLK
ncbi:MAG TPA: cytochrome c [Bryobacteraceae bacterium]|nr:cytochrome c [Bryobacteraceae bacterium]